LTTGAGSGFGRAFTRAAADRGHHVVGTVRREEYLATLEAIGPNIKGVLLDVTDFSAIEGVVDRIEAVQPIDVLINSAGYGHEGVLEESPLADMRSQFEVNLFGAVAIIKAVLPRLRERRSGHIINISSMAGFVGPAGHSLLCSEQIRDRRPVRSTGRGGQGPRRESHSPRARVLPY
jgi:short-subunit dehydrogenase